MPSRDIFEAVATLVHPLPDREAFLEANDQIPEEERDQVYADAREDAERAHEACLAGLHEQAELADLREEEFDPLLYELSNCREVIAAAEHSMRLLFAYGREYVRPQPYQLKDLAAAAGLSISGVRIAYDEEEVREVGDITGDRPRRAWPQDRQ